MNKLPSDEKPSIRWLPPNNYAFSNSSKDPKHPINLGKKMRDET